MYLTAYLADELGRIADDERAADAARARLVRLAACGPPSHASTSLLDRVVLALRPTPQTCPQSL